MTILVNSVVSGEGDNDQMVISTYTSAQLSALADAGGLAQNQKYIPSDASSLYQILEARSVSELVQTNKQYPAEAIPYAGQFSTMQRCLPIKSKIVTASGLLGIGPVAIVGVRCVGKGSGGTLAIYDSVNASTASLLRMSLAQSAATDGNYYPMCDAVGQAALLFATDAYVTDTTGGVWVIDYVDSQSAIAGIEGSGLLCETQYVSATGVALYGPTHVLSVKVLAVGSSDNLIVHDWTDATDATKLRYPSTVYSSLAANQIIALGPQSSPTRFNNGVYVTVPTGGIVLVNYLPR